MKRKKSLWALALVVAAALAKFWLDGDEAISNGGGAATVEHGAPASQQELAPSSKALYAAIREQRSNEWVEGSARIVKTLPDDRDGARHQRFLAELDDGSSLLFAHNLDVAPRVPIEPGDVIRFRGRFEWNDKGGVVHWTHRDERDPTRGGWLRLGDDVFE
jgi:hypothetical protein